MAPPMLFPDVHVEGVEQTLTLGLPTSLTKATPSAAVLSTWFPEAVQHFHAQVDAEIVGEVGNAGDALDAARGSPILSTGFE